MEKKEGGEGQRSARIAEDWAEEQNQVPRHGNPLPFSLPCPSLVSLHWRLILFNTCLIKHLCPLRSLGTPIKTRKSGAINVGSYSTSLSFRLVSSFGLCHSPRTRNLSLLWTDSSELPRPLPPSHFRFGTTPLPHAHTRTPSGGCMHAAVCLFTAPQPSPACSRITLSPLQHLRIHFPLVYGFTTAVQRSG